MCRHHQHLPTGNVQASAWAAPVPALAGLAHPRTLRMARFGLARAPRALAHQSSGAGACAVAVPGPHCGLGPAGTGSAQAPWFLSANAASSSVLCGVSLISAAGRTAVFRGSSASNRRGSHCCAAESSGTATGWRAMANSPGQRFRVEWTLPHSSGNCLNRQ